MKLPSLNALRAFEAAARHQGFVGAAEELHVTRGAISRQVKLLEEQVGAPLFRRTGQGVRLTEAGQRLLPVLTECFERIARETGRISAEQAGLRIICPPATSIRWLIPRLDRFRRAHPEIDIRLTTDFHRGGGFDTQEYDIGFSCEIWPNRPDGIEVLPLFPVLLTPACAPSRLESGPALERPEDLRHHPLLHETPSHADWADWIRTFKVTGLDPASGQDFPNLDMATKAAVMGAGVVMADLVLTRDELEAGMLVTPFPEMTCESTFGTICLLGPGEKWHDPKVRLFRDWVIHEAEADRRALGW
ncbi:LysR substrate-binding domain-containing protein [Tropicimonas sp. IMCC6043]|uniref:LysR substrate-binding domain-containing protein n=1 Tax=Tropicimonas sp. IMCC6043 TaxID=2510645 RepID=UPI00101C6422|nr:LysR substrate-binding domain-containing protein [Tropicimonas sp. IMCC6043]RYH09775.1 LysR family transcriptional regulator [Tropicimonas sp. IMCC6043]